MNAQQKLEEYGNELKAKSNTGLSHMTAQEIIGQAFTKGICWMREASTRYTTTIVRQGKTIIVTENIIAKVVDNNCVETEKTESTIVMTIEL